MNTRHLRLQRIERYRVTITVLCRVELLPPRADMVQGWFLKVALQIPLPHMLMEYLGGMRQAHDCELASGGALLRQFLVNDLCKRGEWLRTLNFTAINKKHGRASNTKALAISNVQVNIGPIIFLNAL